MNRLKALLPFAMFGISLLSVQGTIYVLQIASAATVSVEVFSTIRTTESLAMMMALFVTFGLPSTLLVHARKSSELTILGQIGAASILVILVNAAALSIFSVIASFLFSEGALFAQSALIAFPISVLVGLRLVFTAAGQAQQRFFALSIAALVGSILSLAAFVGFGFIGEVDLRSWAIARILLELIVILGLWRVSFGANLINLETIGTIVPRAWRLFRTAAPLGLSLLIRSLLDHGPILLVAAIGASELIAGEVGLILTVCTIALVPALTAQGVIVPRLVEVIARGGRLPYKKISFLITGGILATSSAVSLLLAMLPYVISWLADFHITTILLSVIIISTKMTASAIGGILLALNQNMIIMKINITTMLFGILTAITLFYSHKISTNNILLSLALTESLGALIYVIKLRRWQAKNPI